MKTRNRILALTFLACLPGTARAADGHDHKSPLQGPNKGRVLEIGDAHAEFFVRPDKKVAVTFFDATAIPPGEQSVTLTAEAASGKTKLDFEKAPDAFVSTAPLPEGDGYRIVLQIRPEPAAKLQNFRIDYHPEPCAKCSRPEYACACEDAGAHETHDH